MKEFLIEPVSLGNAELIQTSENSEYPYTGTAVTPQITVRLSGNELKPDEDYTVSYSDNIERKEVQGKDSVIMVKGIGNYQGELFQPFSIVKSPMERVSMTLEYTKKQWKKQTEFTPKVTVKDGSRLLKKDVDYAVSYADNTEPGEGKVIITALDSERCNYTGSKESVFQIVGKPITNAKVVLSQTSFEMSEMLEGICTPLVTVKDGTKELIPGDDYQLSFRNHDRAGIATVVIEGTGFYSGEKEVTYQIKGIDVTKLKTDKISDQIYVAGRAIEPDSDIVLRDAKTGEAIDHSDFDITYFNNDKVGTASVYIAGKNQYSGTRKLTFKIVKMSLNEAHITFESGRDLTNEQYEAVYTGKKIIPQMLVSDIYGTVLQPGRDYTVTYANNLNSSPEDAKKAPTVILTGKGNYKGSVKRTFTISQRELNADDFRVTIADVRYHNGKELKPTVTLCTAPKTEGEKSIVLKKDRDYTVEYLEHTGNPEALSYGRVIIRGKGNYAGILGDSELEAEQLRFRISHQILADKFIVTGVHQVIYNGTEQKLADEQNNSGIVIFEKRNTEPLTEGIDYRLEFYDNINAGTAKMKVIGIGAYAGEKTVTFKIRPRNLGTSATLGEIDLGLMEAVPYSGYACTPDVEVSDLGLQSSDYVTLQRNTDYLLSYQNNINPSTEKNPAKVTVTGKGNYTGKIKTSFVVEPIEFSSATIKITLQDMTCIYNGKLQKPQMMILNQDLEVPTAINMKSAFDITYLNNKEVGKATIRIRAKGKGWRETTKKSGKIIQTHFDITKGDLSDTTMTTISAIPVQTYRGYQVKPVVTVKVNGVKLKKDRDYTLEYENNGGVTNSLNKAYVILKGIGNYEGEVHKCFEIH